METDRLLESSNIDDRTLHELYLHPFLRGMQANVATVMSSYNQVTPPTPSFPFSSSSSRGLFLLREPSLTLISLRQINNSYAAQNSKVLNGLLKTELGFQGEQSVPPSFLVNPADFLRCCYSGPVISDWAGTHSGVAAALAGLDMEMPDSQ